MRIELDGIAVKNTPDSLRWEPPRFLGEDGEGVPTYGPYWRCHLAFSRTSRVQLQHWYDAMDGETHTIRLPHPITGRYTTFTGVYVRHPESMLNTRDLSQPAAAGVDFTITRLDVT